MDKLGAALSTRGWPSCTVPYARHAFDGDGVKVVAYEKAANSWFRGGKTEDFVSNILEPKLPVNFFLAMRRSIIRSGLSLMPAWMRSGKGDLFGPVVSTLRSQMAIWSGNGWREESGTVKPSPMEPLSRWQSQSKKPRVW